MIHDQISDYISLLAANPLQRCYDSHVHLLATGEWASQLNLRQVRKLGDFSCLTIETYHFRNTKDGSDPILLGQGFDITQYDGDLPTAKDLDVLFPGKRVYFAQSDGHGGIGNTRALEYFAQQLPQLKSEMFDRRGRILEGMHYAVLGTLRLEREDLIKMLLRAQEIFLEAGFTHVRDMTGQFAEWDLLLEMLADGRWKMCVESHLALEPFEGGDFKAIERLSDNLAKIKSYQSRSPYFRPLGMKLFYDGTLGAQTALVSQDYLCPHKGAGFSRGQRAWNAEAFQLAVRRIWRSGLEVSVHVLGDQAADEVVSLIRETMAQTQDGPVFGKLSLEHVELLRPETIQKMKSMHVNCYMQPSHAVSDSQWLPDVIGTNVQYAFRWESLLAAGIPVYWGSDSPIMQPSIELTLQGLLQQTTWKGKNKQSKLLELLRRGHTHPDASFRAPEI